LTQHALLYARALLLREGVGLAGAGKVELEVERLGGTVMHVERSFGKQLRAVTLGVQEAKKSGAERRGGNDGAGAAGEGCGDRAHVLREDARLDLQAIESASEPHT
jgi:hypothetical protein